MKQNLRHWKESFISEVQILELLINLRSIENPLIRFTFNTKSWGTRMIVFDMVINIKWQNFIL